MNLTNRPRRLRRTDEVRRLCRETRLSSDSLIYPIFIDQTLSGVRPIESLPGQNHYGLDSVTQAVEECLSHGVNHCMLFGLPSYKDACGSSAWAEDGVVQQAVRAIKAAYPDFHVITDVCMCEYTDHGHCGILCGHEVDNDKTLEVLSRTALSHVKAGADMVAPSDMMDGRIGVIREALDKEGFIHARIMAYSAKYASAFYGPFRDAVGSAANLGRSNKAVYQMDPANSDEALWEVGLDLEEGADMVMVKPGLPYLDVLRRVKDEFKAPTYAYHVSGEYALLKAAAAAGYIDEKKFTMETMMCFKRAGADGILTYCALDVARWLKEEPVSL